MKKLLFAVFAIASATMFGAAGDVIFKQINPAGTALTDRVQANPSAIRVYGLNSNAGIWQPTQFALGTGFGITGAFGSQTLNFTEAGTGTVTSVSVSNLSPLFTSNVATATTTPAITFTLSPAAQSTFLAGPIVGAGAPVYRSIAVGDLPTIPNSSLQNSAITIAGTSVSLGGSISRDTITGVSSNGVIVRTAANTLTNRTLTGTANEIAFMNGDGVSGNPTASLPSALTFTGKTITGGTYVSGAFNGTIGATTPSTGAFTQLSASTSASGYSGAELRLLGSGNNAITTATTGIEGMYFDHRGTGNTGNWLWRNGTGGSNTVMALSSGVLQTSVGEIQQTSTAADAVFKQGSSGGSGTNWYLVSRTSGEWTLSNDSFSRHLSVSNSGLAVFSSGVQIGTFSSTGLNDTAVGVSVPSTGRFTAVTVGSTTLLTTSVALTNGAGGSVGTLSNAPAAGNPTKWIEINDNGTTRRIPAW